MSLKSLIQIIIIFIIIVILGSVYYNYFAKNKKISLEKNNQTNIESGKIVKTENLTYETIEKKKINNVEEIKNKDGENVKIEETKIVKNKITETQKKLKPEKPKIDNTVKDIEYLTTDKSGNKYKILATSGRTNSENKNILDLDNVRGVIKSKEKSTVYIVSDFAEYNSSNLKSNFYQNVVINYEDKEITCDYFDVDMQTNIAIAHNNVVVTDPQSIMKAGKIILNIETKVININPDNKKNKVKVTIN